MAGKERTFIMIKPDGVKRQLVGRIISKMEEKGLKMMAAKMMHIPAKLAVEHYSEHKGKPFFEGLIEFITSGPVVATIFEGDNAVDIARRLIGATDPLKADPGTIRGDWALFTGKNLVHGSDSLENAEREIALFFPGQTFAEYDTAAEPSLYDA